MDNHYIYVYLDDRKPGQWSFDNFTFYFQPFYIGRGKHHRINHHLQPQNLSDNSIKSNKINSIIKETGSPPTHYKLIENLSFEEVNEWETKLIKHFGRLDIGTGILANMTDGGEGFKNILFSEETKKKMSEVKKGKTGGKLNPRSKRVIQMDMDGNFIREWDSLSDISRETNLTFQNISKCCLGEIQHAYGFKWKYDGSSYERKTPKPEAKDKRKIVYQYSLDGNFLRSYESVSSAKRITQINHIECAATGKHKQVGGFQWRYEFLGNTIPPLIPSKMDTSFRG